jgi:hypothetical protein
MYFYRSMRSIPGVLRAEIVEEVDGEEVSVHMCADVFV